MSRLAIQDEHLTVEEFDELEMNAPEQERWELIGGYIHRMMAGGTAAHNRIVQNLALHLTVRLRERKSRCSVFAENLKLQVPERRLSSYPDVMVVCPAPDPGATAVQDATVLIEVVSPASRERDYVDKPQDYLRLPSLCHYVVVESRRPQVTLHTLRDGAWQIESPLQEAASLLRLPALDLVLSLTEIYEDALAPDTTEH